MDRLKELNEKAETDRELREALYSATENVHDMGIDEYDPAFDVEVLSQVEGWLFNGREW